MSTVFQPSSVAASAQGTVRLREAVRQAVKRGDVGLLGVGLVVAGLIVVAPQALAGPYPGEFNLLKLLPENGGDGSKGAVIEGDAVAVGALGDINGDGIDDVALGRYTSLGTTVVYVLFGRAEGFPASLDLADLAPENGGDGTQGFLLSQVRGVYGPWDRTDNFAGPGDINGDEINDIIVGSTANGQDEVLVLFGRNSGFPAETSRSDLITGDGTNGFVARGLVDCGGSDNGFNYGGANPSVADVNGDGIGDLIVGQPEVPNDTRCYYAEHSYGATYVIFGRSSGFPTIFDVPSTLAVAGGGDGSAGFILHGEHEYDYVGQSTSLARDINGDGVDDMIIGAFGADPDGRVDAGEAYVVFGRAGGGFPAESNLADLRAAHGGDGSTGFVAKGIDPNDRSGSFVTALADVNGDGIDDLAIGAPRADPQNRSAAGETYVLLGQSEGFQAELNVSELLMQNGGDGNEGFVMGGARTSENSSFEVASAGDFNADGVMDIAIATDKDGSGYGSDRSYVVFGAAAGFEAEIDLSDLEPSNGGDGSRGFVILGAGRSIGGAGDLNNDGIDDLVIAGATPYPPSRAFILYGRPSRSEIVLDPDVLDFGTQRVGNPASLTLTISNAGGEDLAIGVIGGIDPIAVPFSVTADNCSGTAIPPLGECHVTVRFVPANIDAFSDTFDIPSNDPDRPNIAIEVSGTGTGEVVCTSHFSSDVPKVIPSMGTSTITSIIEVGETVPIQDINVLSLNGTHSFVGDLEFSLASPSGTSVVVMQRSCGSTDNFDVTLDDEVLDTWPCPPVGGGTYHPRNPLSAFDGEHTDGTWTLTVRDYVNGDGGGLNGWGLQVCAEVFPDLDLDGVTDALDNCIKVSNIDQRDTDNDGFGNICDADLTNDCAVNFEDLGIMESVFFTNDPNADLDGSGAVNFTDIGTMKASFFGAPGPSGLPNLCAPSP